jgi:integrase
MSRLTDRQVKNAKPAADRRVLVLCDGGGLYAQIGRDKTHPGRIHRSWTFRYELAGKRHEMGLGGFHTISLAKARERARELREKLLYGIDPLEEKEKQRKALIAERARSVTFKDVAIAYFALHLDSFRNAKHRRQWRDSLVQHAFPKIGHMTVADIRSADVLRVIEPLWITTTVTAKRLRQRIKKVLDYATERELRSGDNPAASITSLPKTNGSRAHHAALPYAELPAFMAGLRNRNSLAARALEFAILTAARTGEVIGATPAEVDLDARLWTVPAERMKAGREHRVPLSNRAMEILRGLQPSDGPIFPIGPLVMARLLRSMRPDVTVHGFRSSFRDWISEQTNYPTHVAEQALAHAIADQVEAAYRRGDLFERRRKLMSAWANYCGRSPTDTVKVIPIVAAR